MYKLTNENGSTSYLVANLDRWLEEQEVIFEAGVLAALYDALYVCVQTNRPIPQWLLNGVLKVVGDRLAVGVSEGMGAKANDTTALKKDRVHLQRWLAVKKLRKSGASQDKEIFFKAKHLLSEVGADCSDKAIENSYYKVEKDMKDPEKARKYYSPLPTTENLLGLKPILKGVTFQNN